MPDPADVRRARFDALLQPHHDALRAYVHRLVGHPRDADDLVQETLLRGLTRLDTLRDEAAFKGWLFRIATHAALDWLDKQRRWRPFSQRYLEDECDENPGARALVVESTRREGYAFDVREHVSFCFSCVGRSLPPRDAAALVLREVLGLSNREAADMLGVSESVLRHHLAAGREAMRRTFEGLCTLVGKQGICWQCASFRRTAPPQRRGPSLPQWEGEDDAWSARVAMTRERHFLDGVASSLHDVLFEGISRLERPTDSRR